MGRSSGGSVMAGSNVVSLSGGKDSTAMLLMLLERGEDVADIVFFDTGWEFPEMYDHLEKLENFIDRKITRLQARIPPEITTEKSPFDWFFAERPVVKRGANIIHRIGCAWPKPTLRWCTGRKQSALSSYMLGLTHLDNVKLPLQKCIGFAADERHRLAGVTKKGGFYIAQRYPLLEWGIAEADALDYCLKRGFNWNGLYNKFRRVSCFCCPLKPMDEFRVLRRDYPELWQRMLLMESWLPEGKERRFKSATVSDLDARFASEEAF